MIKTVKIISVFLLILISQSISPLYSQTGSDSSDKSSGGLSPWHREMRAVRVFEKPKIDGILDDAVWQNIEFQGDFLSREPFAQPATEETEFAIIYDDENLYIGVRLFDSEPDKIQAFDMRRDAFGLNDDSFDFYLDTFHDNRNAFFFSTNPIGLRLDATISDDGRFNADWDGVWETKSSIDGKGWYIEMAIPWPTLRFPEEENLIWGASFVRNIKRKNEQVYWRLVPLYVGGMAQMRVSEGGYISGLNGLKQGGNFEIKPYISGGVQNDDNIEKEFGDMGVDFKKNLTSTLTADFTYNTDFGQVEADREQINLTRFSLFFPEKREFFLEGSETFRFGQGGGGFGGGRPGNIQLFHSRTIGIEQQELIPIIGGARLNGKINRETTIGFLTMQTGKTTLGPDNIVPTTNFSVLRLRRDVFSRSTIGLMVLNKEISGGRYNRSFGFDTDFKVSNEFSFFLVGAGTISPESSSRRNNFAGNAGFRWQSDLWQYNLSFLDLEKSFQPEMGFVSRTDIRRTNGSLTLSPRLTNSDLIRTITINANGNYQTNGSNRVLNKKIGGRFQINFENSSNISFNFDREFEYLFQSSGFFEVRPGFVIPNDEYVSNSYNFSFRSGNARKIDGNLNISWSDFFTGTANSIRFGFNYRAFNRLIANINYNYTQTDLPAGSYDSIIFLDPDDDDPTGLYAGGNFHTNSLSARITWSFNPDFFIKAFIQWVDDDHSPFLLGRDRFSGNFLLRYTFSPLSDFYLVLNQQTLVGPGPTFLENRAALAKITYFFRK